MTFECATNMTGYTLFFILNPRVEILRRTEFLSNGGVIESLNFTASSEVNVTCFANRNNMNENARTEPAYVYIQGQYYSSMYIHFTIFFQVLLIVSVIYKDIS